MSVQDPREMIRRLREINAALAEVTYHDLKAVPEVGAEVDRLVGQLAERGLLQERGYYTLEQACEKICDAFRDAELPRVKTFSHCGQSHPYHVLQTYVVCPACRRFRVKTRGFFAHDEMEDVAGAALHWLGIDWKTLPGWNLDCGPGSGVQAPGSGGLGPG
jgi:hypothetical protein